MMRHGGCRCGWAVLTVVAALGVSPMLAVAQAVPDGSPVARRHCGGQAWVFNGVELACSTAESSG